MKRVLWTLCLFGFFGMWKLPHKFKFDKTGYYICEFDIPIGMSKRKILNFLSNIQRYSVYEVEGMKVHDLTEAYFIGSNRLDDQTDVLSFLKMMRDQFDSDFFIVTDGSAIKDIESICKKYGARVNVIDRTDTANENLRMTLFNRFKQEAFDVAKADASKNLVECEHCGEQAAIAPNGRCGSCGYPYVRNAYDIASMVQLGLNGKEIKAIKVA